MHHRTWTIAYPLIAFTLTVASCSAQTPSSADARNDPAPAQGTAPMDTAQLSAYIVEALEDSKGNLWFGTVGDGVIRYTPSPSVVPGERLTYFTTEDGLADMVSCSIVEDQEGNIWIGSHDGATRFDGKTFTAFKTPEGRKLRSTVVNLHAEQVLLQDQCRDVLGPIAPLLVDGFEQVIGFDQDVT